MSNSQQQFWIGVVPWEHVQKGISGGYCQFNHGKISSVKRLSRGDFIIYYSPKETRESKDPFQKFTALGEVIDTSPYQVEMAEDFRPFRRNINYIPAKQIAIRPLIDTLPFIKNKKQWGYMFRRGFFQIDRASFEIIARNMLGYSPLD